MKTRVTVIYPVTVEIDFDQRKADDEDYLEEKRDEAKNLADQYIQSSPPRPVIHEADIDELIE